MTSNLKEVTSFDVDLAVSAGAGFIANSYGFEIEDESNDILVKMNVLYHRRTTYSEMLKR